jgi:hypothetical protein
MERNKGYRHWQSIGYLANFPGARRAQDQIGVSIEDAITLAIEADSPLDASAATVTVQEDTPLDASAATLSVQEDTPLDVSGAIVAVQEDTPLDASAATVTVQEDTSLDVSGATVAVQEDTPLDISDRQGRNLGKSRLMDSGGVLVDPARATAYPATQATGHDLDTSGDLVLGPVSVDRASALVVAANSTDNAAWSATVEWVDGNSNTFQTQSSTDIDLDTVIEDWSRLVRKGPQVKVTFTDESGDTNNINAHLDTEA